MAIFSDGFESYSTNTANPGSWNSTHDEFTVTTEVSAYEGSQVWGDIYYNVGSWPNSYSYRDDSVIGGEPIRAVMWFKSPSASGSGDGNLTYDGSLKYVWEDDARLHLYAKDSNGNTLKEWKTMWTGERSNPNQSGWNKHELIVTLPDNATTLRFQIDHGDGNDSDIDPENGHYGNGGGYFDGTVLEYTATDAPTNLTSSVDNNETVNLSWDSVRGADGYNIYRSTSSGSTKSDYTQIDNISVDLVTYSLGFEDMSNWSTTNGQQVSDRVYEGSYSYYSGNDGSNEQATLTLDSGIQLDSITYYYQETSNSTGGGVRFVNSNGNYEGGIATDNPQWHVDFANTSGEVDAGSDYNNWIKVTLDFDWSNTSVTVSWEDLNTGRTYSDTYTLKNGVDIKSVELWNYNGGTWGDNNLNMWWDGIYAEKSNPPPTSYNDINLLDGEKYFYRVSAYDSNGEGNVSNETSSITNLPAPSNLTLNT